jgi:hypothetical protein
MTDYTPTTKDLLTTDTTLADEAYGIGEENGAMAAEWCIDDSVPYATAAKIWQGLADGDPLVMDAYKVPDLGGEYAGDYSEADLADDLGIDPTDGEAMTEAAEAYLQGTGAGFWAKLEAKAAALLDFEVVADGIEWEDADGVKAWPLLGAAGVAEHVAGLGYDDVVVQPAPGP